MVTVVWGLTKRVSFHSVGETSNELVFLSGCVAVVINCDVLVAQITLRKVKKKHFVWIIQTVKWW